MRGHDPLFVPCTPKGCIELLRREKVQMDGKNAVVIGRRYCIALSYSMDVVRSNNNAIEWIWTVLRGENAKMVI